MTEVSAAMGASGAPSPFLLHLVPRFFGPYAHVQIVDLTIEPIGLVLRGGIDLATRKPFPNKNYSIACRKQGQRAINGIIIEMPRPTGDLLYTARWSIDAELVVTHTVRYRILDQDHSAASDDEMLWNACSAGLGGWSSRWPQPGGWDLPAFPTPMMEAQPRPPYNEREERLREKVADVLGQDGRIVERRQDFHLPTIEPERLTSRLAGPRMPALDTSWKVGLGVA